MNKKSIYKVLFASILMNGTALFASDAFETPKKQIRQQLRELPKTDDMKKDATIKYSQGGLLSPGILDHYVDGDVVVARRQRDAQALDLVGRLQALELEEKTKKNREAQQKLHADRLAEINRQLAENQTLQDAAQRRSDQIRRELEALKQQFDIKTAEAERALAEKDAKARLAEAEAVKALAEKAAEADRVRASRAAIIDHAAETLKETGKSHELMKRQIEALSAQLIARTEALDKSDAEKQALQEQHERLSAALKRQDAEASDDDDDTSAMPTGNLDGTGEAH